jgi:polar amino acid transport system permease protein
MDIQSLLIRIHSTAPLLAKGAWITIEIWLCALLISLALGSVVGTLRCTKLKVRLLAPILDIITLLLRGVPLYAQLMILYFVLPELLGINFSAFSTGIIGLGICSAAYTSEIIRGALNGVPEGQWEAASALGYSPLAQIRFIIFPQALCHAMPALVNEYVMALKSTSLLASIGTLELTKVGMNIIARSLDPVAICLSIALIYLCMSWVISSIGQLIERNLNAYR